MHYAIKFLPEMTAEGVAAADARQMSQTSAAHDDHYIALTESGANYFSNDPMKTWP